MIGTIGTSQMAQGKHTSNWVIEVTYDCSLQRSKLHLRRELRLVVWVSQRQNYGKVLILRPKTVKSRCAQAIGYNGPFPVLNQGLLIKALKS